MTTSRSAFSLTALTFLWTLCVSGGGQKVDKLPSGGKQQVIFLNFGNNGQRLVATVGQQIEISLGARSPCEPVVSSPSIQLESVALEWPPPPGIATHVYIFFAASPGEAQVRIAITNCSKPDLPGRLTFGATIRVEPTDGEPSTPYASETPDQVNTAPWTGAWTAASNHLRQSFTPSLPKLTGVELQLVAGNPGPANSEVTVTLRNAKEEILSVVSKTVPVDDCGQVLFVFPKGSWRVSLGEVYSIEVHGADGVLGWKYVAGGYSRGSASIDGKPLLQGARSTFLFRTFGAS